MNLSIGIDNSIQAKDIDELIQAGAGEFFCGFVPKSWRDIYGYEISLNKRYSAREQYSSIDDLRPVVEKAHFFKKKIFATFNAHYYSREQYSLIKKYLRQMKKLNIDGLIISDLGLLLEIRKLRINLDIIISSDAGLYNSESVRFFSKFNIKRVILPRHLNIKEIKQMVGMLRKFRIECEVFIMGQRCPFEAAYCRASHGWGTADFCHQNNQRLIFKELNINNLGTNKEVEARDFDRICVSPSEFIRWNDNAGLYNLWRSNVTSLLNSKDFLIGECGLCAMKAMQDMGVDSLKIVARGKTKENKILALKMLDEALKAPHFSKQFCKKIKGNPQLCELGYKCYYREAAV